MGCGLKLIGHNYKVMAKFPFMYPAKRSYSTIDQSSSETRAWCILVVLYIGGPKGE